MNQPAVGIPAAECTEQIKRKRHLSGRRPVDFSMLARKLLLATACVLAFGGTSTVVHAENDAVPKDGAWKERKDPHGLDISTLVPIPDHVTPPRLASTRKERFPSREERLKVYMSNWYVPPCPDYEAGMVTYQYEATSENVSWPVLTVHTAQDFEATTEVTRELAVESAIVPDTTFFVDPGTVLDCLVDESESNPRYQDRIKFRKNMNMYCTDVASTVLTALQHVDWEQKNETLADVPTLVQFGDLKHSHIFGHVNVPLLKKFRSSAVTPQALHDTVSDECYRKPRPTLQTFHPNNNQFQPIIWKLAARRHFGNLERVYREDTSWENKNNMAVFRGQMTGTRNDGYNKHLDDETNCLRSRRCRLVYTHHNSTLIHARLTSTRNRLPNTINGVKLVASAVTLRRLLAFKGIIMLEGNDVASGLKWALLSQSVVLMPTPKHTSWAMEELLEPWVHYVPLNDNATDVEEKMQWVVDNDEAAKAIAQRSSLWMEDLVFHPDAAEDDRWIQEEIIRRYRTHFLKKP